MSQTKSKNGRGVSERKKQRIKKAVAMYYGKEMKQKEIAKELNVTRKTVARYINSDVAEDYISPYSKKSEYEIRKMVEDRLEEYFRLEDQVKQEIRDSPEISGDKKTKLLREFRNGTKDVVEVLDSIGVFEKSPEKHRVEHEGGGELVDRLRTYFDDGNGEG